MRPIIILAFITIAIAYSTYRYLHTSLRDDGNITLFESGFSGYQKYLSPMSKINFVCPNNDVQKLLESRFVLFPIVLDLEKDQKYDTALVIVPKEDTNYQFLGSIFWKNEDEKYNYYLVKK